MIGLPSVCEDHFPVRDACFIEGPAGGFESGGFVERDHRNLGVKKNLLSSQSRGRRYSSFQEFRSDAFSAVCFQHRHPPDFCAPVGHHQARRADRFVANVGEEVQSIAIGLVNLDFPRHMLFADKNPEANAK
jgi:hypothetical protein